MIYERDELSLEKVKSNLEMKENIDKNLADVKGNDQGVTLFIDRGRTKERNSSFGKSRFKSRHGNLSFHLCKR